MMNTKCKYFLRATWVAVALMVLTAPAAMADLYLTGEGGITTHEIPYYDQSSAYNLGVGVIGPRRRFGFEASYVNLGDAAILTGPTDDISMSGYNVSTFYQIPAYPLVYGVKLGFYTMNAVDTLYGTATSGGVSWGAYMGYQPSDSMLIYWDAEGFNNVQTPYDGPETPTILTVGVRFYFGVRPLGSRGNY